jgi:hypothetical protein
VSAIFRTLIVTADTAPLARSIADTLDPRGAAAMWETPLSPTGALPATHFVSSGWIPPAWQAMVPTQWYAQDDTGAWVLVSETPGDPLAVIAGCAAQGVEINPAALAALYASADVTEQDPWTALARRGLRLVQEPDA